MALSKEKKAEVVSEVSELLAKSKLTVVVKYPGTSVKAMQSLRKEASQNGTTVKVIKNRLFKLAVAASPALKESDVTSLTGQLLYAFNAEDEVAPAQSLANFAKVEPQLQFVGAIRADGQFLTAQDVQVLASLPSKDQLRGQAVGTIAAPLSGFVNVLAGNVRGVLNALNARAQQLE